MTIMMCNLVIKSVSSLGVNTQQVPRRQLTMSLARYFSYNQREALHMTIKVTRNLGLLLLAIWLILGGLMPLLNIGFSGANTIMAILAVAAGVLILIGR